jgi:hypothetical protein
MLAGVPGWIDDDIVLGRVQFAERLIGKLAVAQRRAALQPDIAEIEDLIIQRHGSPRAPKVSKKYDGGCRNGNRRRHRCGAND